MTSWPVMAHRGEIVTTPGEKGMHEACFPPTAEEAKELQLERCMRMLPHHCEGGCFFIAVLEKVSEYEQPPLQDSRPPPKAARTEAVKGDDASANAPPKDEEEPKERVPPRYLPSFDESKSFLTDFFGAAGFPVDHLYSRAAVNEGALKKSLGTTCMFVAEDVRRIITPKTRLIVVAAGLRVLAVESLTKSWRVAHESGFVIEKFITNSKRVIDGVPADVAQMCGPESEANGVTIEKVEREGLREDAEKLEIGSGILRIATGIEAQPFVPVAFMRARNRVQLLVDKDDLDDLKCRLDIGAPHAAICQEAAAAQEA